ncbi:vWA domain-containing protein [Virgibacillus ndiopensis]|uniref:vWA domain-containing protein n=1 Tax=Virgibacillus ndiopensis TaxID=2004408 RepID=UPI000C0835CB|nr:vWA domain-containing protein [Virgibacillus ndiopensis]
MNKNLTEIIFLLDRSGSMSGLESDTIGGFNTFIEMQNQIEGETIVTTVLFDDKYEILWNGIVGKQARLTEKDYYVRGMTALLDAVGKTILDVSHRLSNCSEDDLPGKVIFVITTDGLENVSCEFTYEKVKKLIAHHQEKYNWDFIFLGANIDASQEANRMGIITENAFDYEATSTGMEKMYDTVNKIVTDKRQ